MDLEKKWFQIEKIFCNYITLSDTIAFCLKCDDPEYGLKGKLCPRHTRELRLMRRKVVRLVDEVQRKK
jgi:hypothetical protein